MTTYALLSAGLVWHIRSDVWGIRDPRLGPDRTTCCGRRITGTTRLAEKPPDDRPVCATCARVARR